MENRYYNQGWFGRHPEIYDRMDFFMKYLRREAAKRITQNRNQKVIDIATGTGAQGFEFTNLGHSVIGIDIDDKMLRQAQMKAGNDLVFIHGDATSIPLSSNLFDIAVISFAMHDVPFVVGVKILKEAYRVLRDSGRLYIVDHGDPKESLAARILYWIALSFETPNHKLFFKRRCFGRYFGKDLNE